MLDLFSSIFLKEKFKWIDVTSPYGKKDIWNQECLVVSFMHIFVLLIYVDSNCLKNVPKKKIV